MTNQTPRVLITGATGYIGALLTERLAAHGFPVRAMVRRPGVREWPDGVMEVQADADDPASLSAAMDGVEVVYYLLHSMDGSGDFVERDRQLARNVSQAAREAGVSRIVYLSGLHPEGELSAHLGSRVEVGQILLDSGVPTAVLQAGVVLGAGSASFDMLRHLTERLPVMIAPKWLTNRIQPIAVDDALYYLEAAATLPPEVNRSFDIGGPDVLTYKQMIKRYARRTGLGRRPIGVVPVLTPWLASHWVGVITPVDAGIAKPLVGSLVHEAVMHENDLASMVGEPTSGNAGFEEAIDRAVTSIDPTLWRTTARRVAAMVAACAVAGSLLTDPEGAWYQSLRKPSWQPPGPAFGIVWTALYTAIGVAATATIAELTEDGVTNPDAAGQARQFERAFAVNLVLNAAWSGLFFRSRRLPLASVEAAVLALSSADLARRAAPTGPGKVAALGTYAAWCTFATVLSSWVAAHNPQD